jgi:hypothetical protein
MAKASGIGDQFYIGGYDLSGEVSSLGTVHGGNSPLDVTPINVSANVRLGGQRDGSIEFSTWMDTAAGHEHAALSPLPTADVIATYFRGAAVGNDCASQVSKQINYDWSRGTDGSLAGSVQCQSNGFGLEWGTQLTPGRRVDGSATAAGAGNSFDTGASLSFGGQAYVHLFAFAGTSVTISIWDSADNSSFLAVAGFTTIALTSAPQAVRISIANTATIRRYVAVATAGTFSNADFAVHLTKNATAGQVF